jgi:SAM-dependent methyltransferase
MRSATFTIGSNVQRDLLNVELDRPKVTYNGPEAERDSRELFSAAEPWLVRNKRLLDLGCGPRDQAAPAAHCGLEYVGVDFSSSVADLLADAHAIPFRSATFDIVLSYAVLEHLYNPFLAIGEISRVLKTGGMFVGTVSQGEPFHDSYFHHTSWGLLMILRSGNLEPRRIWPSYDTLHALARMGRYARAHRALLEVVYRTISATPFFAPRRFFNWSKRERQVDALHKAASVCFVAVKTPSREGAG